MEKIILTEQQIEQKIARIAYEIYENNFGYNDLVLIGIAPTGYLIAQRLARHLQEISPIKPLLGQAELDKKNPLAASVKIDLQPDELRGKSVVIVDDVLNSGKTIAHCLAPLLAADPKKLEVAVLVNRSHKSFPISARYKGYDLSTTLEEHISVKLGDEDKVLLY
ncbi:MAG: phosphoribosyltransferase [Cytophagales bacterium]|nr:phosphoribosyltransferase [Cytophagales bacterium]